MLMPIDERTDWRTDWLTDWPIGWLIERLSDWATLRQLPRPHNETRSLSCPWTSFD